MIRRLLGLLMLAALTGCGTTLKPVKPDAATGLFPTTVAVSPTNILVAERFDPAYRKMVHLKVEAQPANPLFVDYFTTSIKDTGVFEQVLTKSDLQTIVIERELQDKVSNVSDVLGLNILSKQIGNFLILVSDAQWKGGYNFEGTMQGIDASTGKTVFKSSFSAFNWDGLDIPMYRPMLNSFVLWAKGELPVVHAEVPAAVPTARK